MENTFATVSWTIEDVICARQESGLSAWNEEEARQWLENNQRHIKDRLIELGWGVIRDLMTE